MKKYLLVIVVSAVISATYLSCTKTGDLDGNANITGTACLLNTLDNNSDTVLLKNAGIKIKYTRQQQDFLYTTYTDSFGKFRFTNLSDDENYIIYSDFDSLFIPYHGMVQSKATNTIKLIVYPDSSKFNAAVITVVDANNSPINGIKVYRFLNKTYFDSTDLSEAIDSFPTLNSGTITYLNQPAGVYYLFSTFSINNSSFTGRQNITLTKEGIVKDSLKVSR